MSSMSVDFAFLDSGTGGLPYLKHLLDKKTDARCVYVGDTANFPYGEKTEVQIIENSCKCAEKIIERWSPEVIVVACNTISVTALNELRIRFPETSFVGTVPAIKPASLASKKRCIGLLATNATVNHPYTKKLISDFASDCKIVSRGDPELISFIEHKFFDASEEERLNAVMPSVDFFKKNGCDVVVLACTHFLNMSEYIKNASGEELKVVDSREGVVNHAIDVINGLEDKSDDEPFKSSLYITGFRGVNDSERYEDFCRSNNILFGGLLEM